MKFQAAYNELFDGLTGFFSYKNERYKNKTLILVINTWLTQIFPSPDIPFVCQKRSETMQIKHLLHIFVDCTKNF